MKVLLVAIGRMGQRYRRVLQSMYKGDIHFTTVDPKAEPTPGDDHYKSIEEVPASSAFDIAIDAHANTGRLELFRNFTDRQIPHIVVEKPPAASMNELNALMQHAKGLSHKPRVLIPFFQRYAEAFAPKTLAQLEAGPLKSFTISGGAIGIGCNGIHSIDLANFIFQSLPVEISASLKLNSIPSPRGAEFKDHGGIMHLIYPSGTFTLEIIPDSSVGTNATLIFERGKIVILEQEPFWQWYQQPKDQWSQPFFRTHMDAKIPAPVPFSLNTEELMVPGLQALLSSGPIPDLTDGYNALKAIALGILAHNEKRTVRWTEDDKISKTEFQFT